MIINSNTFKELVVIFVLISGAVYLVAIPNPPSLPIKQNMVDVTAFTNKFDGTNALITGIHLQTVSEYSTNILVFSNRTTLIIDGKVKAFAINPSEWGPILNDKRLYKSNFTNMTIKIQLP